MSAEHTTTSLKPTRGSFIRGLPLTMPIEEVIERGREAGLELQPSDIHSTRYYMRQASAAEAARKSSVTQQLQLGPGFIGQAAKGADTKQGSLDRDRDRDRDHDRDRDRDDDGDGDRDGDRDPREANGRAERRAPARNKRALKHAPVSSGSLDDQLRVLVLRLGTDRTRAVIAELEALADRIARER